MTRRLVPLVALLAASCAAPGLPGRAPQAPSRPASITVQHEATLRFQPDWNVLVESPPILAGGSLRVVYHPARLPDCRATKYGLPAWSILMYWRFDDGPVQSVGLGHSETPMTATVTVPESARQVRIWFFNNDYYGCKAWDTNLGSDYVYPVLPPAPVADVTFDTDWSEVASPALVQGGMARLVYAPDRLPVCRYAPGGARAWNIYAGWRFEPGGESGTAALFGLESGGPYDAVAAQPVVAIPLGATSVAFWFSNSDATGCVAWDSDYGSNYVFPVSPGGSAGPAVGWAGDEDFVQTANTDQHLGPTDPVYYFDSWQGIPLASRVEVQVWIAGLTDQTYPDPSAAAAAASLVMAEVVTDAFSGPQGGLGTRALRFERQQGHNFVFGFRLGELRWPQNGLLVPDGLHRYGFRFSADGGTAWTAVGLGTDGAPLRRLVVASTLQCDLFPDSAPPECPPSAQVGWVGAWGRYATHACIHQPDLPDPLVLTKSAVGHDCMGITAEVWIPGGSDRGGQPTGILAEVETDLGFGGGPLAVPQTWPLTFDGTVGGNFRYVWHVGTRVGMAERDDYRFRFRFSADGGQTWTVLGQGDTAGYRSLWVRLDSQDVAGGGPTCEAVVSWDGASSQVDGCLDYTVEADYDANFCEFFANAVGRGQWSHSGSTLAWLEAYLSIGAQVGELLGAGMWVRAHDPQGGVVERLSLGRELEPAYWRVGFTYARSGLGVAVPTELTVDAFSFFIDVRRPAGSVERLWQSAAGADYTPEATWAEPGWVTGLGSGSVEYALDSSPALASKAACQP